MSKLSFVSGISEKDGLIFLSSATTEIFQLCVWTRSSCRWLIRAEQNESENIGRSWSHSSSKELNHPSSGGVVSWSDSYRTSHTVCAFGWKLFVVMWHFQFASRVSLSFYLNVHVFIDSLRGKSLKSMQQTKWWLVDDFWSFWAFFLSVVNTDPERQDFKEQKHLVTQQHRSDCNSYSSLWEREVKDICVLLLTNRRFDWKTWKQRIFCRHDSVSLDCFLTGPEELPVQSVSGGGPEDPHGDGPQLHWHSQRKLQRGETVVKE